MTVIAAMDCGDYLLLGADGLVTEAGGVKVTRQKLAFRTDRPLAWGFSGDELIGLRFNRWLLQYPWSEQTTWESLGEAAITELSRLNGRKRELAQLARVEVRDDDLATVLMAGFVDGISDVWELSDRGAAGSVKHSRLAAIGSGHPHAMIAHAALSAAVKGTLSHDPQTMGFILSLTATCAPMCGPPIRIVRISAEGAQQIIPPPDGGTAGTNSGTVETDSSGSA